MAVNDTRLGQTIDGRFVVRRFIGKGGMGAVYEGEETATGRRVAIKFLVTDKQRPTTARERFRREGRLASQVLHAHVAQVYEVGETPDGDDFLVMEYVEGRDLAAALAEAGPLAVERAVAITVQLLAGLGAIHARGIVHRDIKPSNVLLTSPASGGQDFVKIVDFGLARGDADATLTKTGHVVGTTPFMAPEMFRGQRLDARADLYAVGITLYQLLAGKVPFQGATAEVAGHHVYSPPPSLAAQRAGIPPAIIAAVERALAKSPQDRFPDAIAMQRVLRGLPERPRPRWPFVVAAIAVVGGGALGAVLARRHAAPAAPAVPAAPTPVTVPVAADAALPGDAPQASSVAADAAVPPADAAASAVVDAGTRSAALPRPGQQLTCSCMANTGENSPLCARAGQPLCRCDDVHGHSLCVSDVAECKTADATDLTDQCLRGNRLRCVSGDFERFTQPATPGGPCHGIVLQGSHAEIIYTHLDQPADGHWVCDTCPRDNNHTYKGVEGDPCTGYHWQTGAPVRGTLRHCD